MMAKKNTKRSKPSGAKPAGPLAALYNLDSGTKRGDAVRAVLAARGIRVKTVTADMLGDPVGAIVGLVGFRRSSKPFAGDVPETEFMLLHNVTGQKLTDLLAAMRQADCSIGCKAQVTQANRLWPFGTLVTEVSREHAAMSSGPANS